MISSIGAVSMMSNKLNKKGFTIVELLVVIVIIGILAAITIVSYSGISSKAVVASLQSDLDNNSKLLKLYNVEYGYYPSSLDGTTHCPTAPTVDSRYCLKASNDTSITYLGGGQSFTVTATKNSIKYQVTESSTPTLSQIVAGPDWITIGTQTWAKANLNVGTMITGATNQTNNSTLEKYCYGNTELNCTTYGGLYQWNEAMQYITTEGAQGVCPTGSHIPTRDEWYTLISYLGTATSGTQLKIGGSSGLDVPIAGYRDTSGSFSSLLSFGYLWASSIDHNTNATNWALNSVDANSSSNNLSEDYGLSVRCIGN